MGKACYRLSPLFFLCFFSPRSLDPKLLSNPDVCSLIDAHTSVLDSAIQKAPMSEAMRRALGDSNFIFSGIKVFHELNEAFPSLVDSNGDLKPFEQFLNDVQKMNLFKLIAI